MVSIERVEYLGWSEAYRLHNGHIELIIPQQIGIRILHCGLIGQPNEFYVDQSLGGTSGGPDWHLYGGHRLWHSPEAQPRTYFPDNHPIQLEAQGDLIRLIQPLESTTGIAKEIDLHFSPDQAHVKVVHRLRNQNPWAVEFAPWALSVMNKGGVGILPLPSYGTHGDNLLPNRNLILWAYSRMTDPRWTWGDQFILLRQDSSTTEPQKIGLDVSAGWTAYANAGRLFLKTFQPIAGAVYPDRGSSVEMFTNEFMLEVETLGPLTRLEPGVAVEHAENWFLFDGVKPPHNDTDAAQLILPKAAQALATSR